MKINYCTLAFLFLWMTGFCISSTAQMKSCCEPDGVKLVSTVKQSKGTLRMVKILDSLSMAAMPEDFYMINGGRAEIAKKKAFD
jgi:hypothetical protein